MKYKIFICIFLLFVICTLFLIPSNVYAKVFNKKQEDMLTTEVCTYAYDIDNRLIGINYLYYGDYEDEIYQKWECLTLNNCTPSLDVYTVINHDTILLNYEICNNTLKLYFNESFLSSYDKKAIDQIAWTYCSRTIEEIKIFVNDELINKLGDYHFDKIDKNRGINLTYDTINIYHARNMTIIYYEDEYIIPVTYLYDDTDDIKYLFSHLFDFELILSDGFNYKIENEIYTIDIDYNMPLTTKEIMSLCASFEYNYNFSEVIIKGTNSILLECINSN